MSKRRFFTKSLYRKAIECPTKLFYSKKPDEYVDVSVNDDFLKALARGGFQVGALAQCYYPEGILVDTLDYDAALAQTNELLKRDNVVIFEAALAFEKLFVRADILVKKGNSCELIEVKSSTVNPSEFESELWHVKKFEKGVHVLKADWYMELYDIAFQTHVCRKSKPDLKFEPLLMCPDKTKVSPIDGLNQKFFITQKNGRNKVEVRGEISKDILDQKILCQVHVHRAVDVILSDAEMSEKVDGKQFHEGVAYYSKMFLEDQKIKPTIGSHCKSCEFRSDEDGLKSGFKECFRDAARLSDKDIEAPMVFDIWNFRGSEKLIEKGVVLARDVEADDLKIKESEEGGLSSSERQWLQVETVKDNRKQEYLDIPGLTSEITGWRYPLHFIDFETCMVALPFNKGKRPYEQIAFQFSHHKVTSDQKISHAGEFIDTAPGKFPNFDFVRALKGELEKDDGTIFRYAAHENTVLNQIKVQLEHSQEPDRAKLITWIESVTSDSKSGRSGNRVIVDLLEMVKKYFYHPSMGGSNSLKYVLPAVLNGSKYLQDKYSKPVYGFHGDILSRNFETMTWIQREGQQVKDPYSLLEPVFKGYDGAKLDRLMEGHEEIRNGGTAMTAYCYLQFSEMSAEERRRIEKALLRYCELDTLAMVMLWEHWVNQVGKSATEGLKKRSGTER